MVPEIIGIRPQELFLVGILRATIVDKVNNISLEHLVSFIVRKCLSELSEPDGFFRHNDKGSVTGQANRIARVVLLTSQAKSNGIGSIVGTSDLTELTRINIVALIRVRDNIGGC